MEIWTEDDFWVHFDESTLSLTIGQGMGYVNTKTMPLEKCLMFAHTLVDKLRLTPVPDYIKKEFDAENK